jgi:tartrate-resistant acid phosphatase type 5
MGVVGEKLNIDYVISTGDNFYEDGLKSVDDAAFHESFCDVYTADSIKTPWYLSKCCIVWFFENIKLCAWNW